MVNKRNVWIGLLITGLSLASFSLALWSVESRAADANQKASSPNQRLGKKYELKDLPGYRDSDKQNSQGVQKVRINRPNINTGNRVFKIRQNGTAPGNGIDGFSDQNGHRQDSQNMQATATGFDSRELKSGPFAKYLSGQIRQQSAGQNRKGRPGQTGGVTSFHGGAPGAGGTGLAIVDLGCPSSNAPSVQGTNVLRSMACARCSIEQRVHVGAKNSQYKMSMRWQSLMTVMAHVCGVIASDLNGTKSLNQTALKSFKIAESLGHCDSSNYDWNHGSSDSETRSMRNIDTLLLETEGVASSLASVVAHWEQGGELIGKDGSFWDWISSDDEAYRFRKIYGIDLEDLAEHLGCEKGGAVAKITDPKDKFKALQALVMTDSFADEFKGAEISACAREATANVRDYHSGPRGFCAEATVLKREGSDRQERGGDQPKIRQYIDGQIGSHTSVSHFPYAVIDAYLAYQHSSRPRHPSCYIPTFQTLNNQKPGQSIATIFSDPFLPRSNPSDLIRGSELWKPANRLPNWAGLIAPTKYPWKKKRPPGAKIKIYHQPKKFLYWQGGDFKFDRSQSTITDFTSLSLVSFNGSCFN